MEFRNNTETSRTGGTDMKIALASCSNLPDWEVDDYPFWEALKTHNVDVHNPDWRDNTLDWSSFDAVLIRTTWDYTDHPSEFLKWLKHVNQQTLLLNSLKLIQWNFNKSYLKDLEQKGASIAPTLWLKNDAYQDIDALMKKQGWTRGFIKPIVGACAIGTLRFNIEDSEAATQHLRSLKTDCMLQPYIESVEKTGELSLIYFDGVLSHAVRKVPVPGDYRVQDDYGASDEAITPPIPLKKMGHHVLTLLEEVPLYARVDALWHQDKWVLNELELIEPSLFFRHSPNAANLLCSALIKKVEFQDQI